MVPFMIILFIYLYIVTQGSSLQATKVAVALAVLRNKPDNITGSKYAEILCEKFKASQQHWKQQYEKAGTEILHLKQQLAIHTLTQSCEKVLEDSLPSDSQSLFPTPPPSGSTRTSQTDCTQPSALDAQFSLAKHTEFLHHLINIQTASNTVALNGSLQELAQQSLLHSLQLLQNHIGDYTLSWRMQEECVQSIVALVEKCDIHLADFVVEKVSCLCSKMINDIMSNVKQDYKVLERRSQLLAQFTKCKHFTASVLNLLCDTVKDYSDDLRECAQNGKFPDTNKFCNSYFIFHAAELCISKTGRLSNEEKLNIKTKLEDSLLHITEKFPLFAHAVWRLCGNIL